MLILRKNKCHRGIQQRLVEFLFSIFLADFILFFIFFNCHDRNVR